MEEGGLTTYKAEHFIRDSIPHAVPELETSQLKLHFLESSLNFTFPNDWQITQYAGISLLDISAVNKINQTCV